MQVSKKGNDTVSDKVKANDATGDAKESIERKKVKFEIHGEELIEKMVKASRDGWIKSRFKASP